MRALFTLLATILLLGSLFMSPLIVRADAADFDIPNGHFYTQAAGSSSPAGSGYAIIDGNSDSRGQTIKFWSEFRRLGGVNALGYPA